MESDCETASLEHDFIVTALEITEYNCIRGNNEIYPIFK